MSSEQANGAAPPRDAQPPDAIAAIVAERPEVAVGVAFAGGLLLARILRRLGR
jgi:hypothetical protein